MPNLHVWMLLRSLKDRDFVTLVFNWQYYYYFLNQEGHAYLNNFLGLTDNVVPLTWMYDYTLHEARTIIRSTRSGPVIVAGHSGLLAVPESAVTVPTGETVSRAVVVAEEKVVRLRPSSPRLPLPVLRSKPQPPADRYLNRSRSESLGLVETHIVHLVFGEVIVFMGKQFGFSCCCLRLVAL